MKKARVYWNSAVALGASLCWLPALSLAQTTYLGAGGLGINPTGTPPNPNRSNGNGGQFGNNGDIISSVVITTGYENIQSSSTTVPPNAVIAPAIFFQINVYSPTTGTATDITTSAQSGYFTDYDLGLETVPGAGLVSTPATVSNAYGVPFGISTGMNYFIPGFNNKTTSPSTSGGNQVWNYSNGAWAQTAGVGQTPFNATTTVITPTSITYGIPLSELGLGIGNTFTFDAYTTFGSNGQSAYDDLDNPNFAPAGYFPYSNGAGTPSPYDSATAGGSLASYTVQTPTLTWNNATAAAGFADGMTWDTNDTNQFNWNNGMFADYYVDGSNVIFNDEVGGTSVRNVTLNTTVSPNSVLVNNSAGNYTIGGAGSIAGTTSLTKSGSSNLFLNTKNTYTGGTNVTAGTLVVGVNGAVPNGAVSITGGTLQLATSTGLAEFTSIAISGNGTFDVGNNHVIIDYGSGPDPIASIAALLAKGYNGGAWNGVNGIVTSAPLIVGGLTYGLGYADGADPQHMATGLASGNIEIKYTLLGDADLNGIVNGLDFGILAANFNKGITGWDEGDFDYNNIVNGLDFGDLAANFNKGAAGTDAVAALDAFAAANGLLADVPEPASGLSLLASAFVLARRRRKARV